MGSAQSTSNTQDPWWPIENNDFILEQPSNNLLINNNNNNNNNTNDNNTIIIEENENLNNQTVKNTINCSGEQSENPNQIDKNLSKELNLSESDEKSVKEFVKYHNTEELVEEASGGIGGGSSRISREGEQSLEEFKEELRLKRMARQNAIDDLRMEINRLKSQLTEERELTRRLRNGDESCKIITQDIGVGTTQDNFKEKFDIAVDGNEDIRNLKIEIAETQFSLQLANAENLSLNTELDIARKQVISLKDVITCSKQVIEVREDQVHQLKGKLREIENSLAEREMKILSDDLRKEYDKQLENIRNLRQLYEERARVSAAERENLERQISIKKDELTSENEKNKHLEERILTLESDLQNIENEMKNKKSECSHYMYENRELKEEMAVINKLFSQTLIGFNGTNCLDIDRLTTMLEENRTLLNEMATKETKYEGASLPKLLFELVKQANNSNELTDNESLSATKLNTKEILNDAISLSNNTNEIMVNNIEENAVLINNTENNGATSVNENENEKIDKVASAQEIIGNLPKVWRVLMELLNHQKINQVEINENGQSEDCYKSVETPNGPKAEISVSKTYIKLKDLILEKKSLLKETTRLKTLNSHLENRLNHREKRLSMVSLELTKTWHLVGKMQRQHRQLHTHEQILRYQLQQKRRLLNELKEELEYCRRKWAAARAKNDESQLQCNDMRREFAKRKLEDANNSAESGYSDGPGSDEDDNNAINTKQNISKKSYEDLFKNDKKIERMNSTTPISSKLDGFIPRSQSVPTNMILLDNIVRDLSAERENLSSGAEGFTMNVESISKNGAIPKQSTKKSKDMESLLDSDSNGETSEESKRTDRTYRINRLEEQCKSLIAQVLETSDCREKLEIQLCRFQDEMPPVQHPIPLEEFIEKKRQSKSPSPKGDTDVSKKCNEDGLTAREEEYTRKRSERIQRLEDESKLLMSRIKRTTVRGNNMKSLLDHIHARCVSSREGSFDSNFDDSEKPSNEICATEDLSKTEDSATDDELTENNDVSQGANGCLTAREEGYTHRRSERLRRLEEESKSLLSRLAKNSERGTKINTKLNNLHNKYGSEDSDIEISHTTQNHELLKKSETPEPTSIEDRLKVVDDASVKRAERLKVMEEESKKLLTKLSNTSDRGTEMIDHLDQNRKRKDEAIRKKDEEKLVLEESIRISAQAEKLIREQNVAMSSIVPEHTTEFAIVTQTASQIAQSRGAKPKQPQPKPSGIAALELSCSKKRHNKVNKNENEKREETLEEMFLRLSGEATSPNGPKEVTKDDEVKNDSNENDPKDKDSTD